MPDTTRSSVVVKLIRLELVRHDGAGVEDVFEDVVEVRPLRAGQFRADGLRPRRTSCGRRRSAWRTAPGRCATSAFASVRLGESFLPLLRRAPRVPSTPARSCPRPFRAARSAALSLSASICRAVVTGTSARGIVPFSMASSSAFAHGGAGRERLHGVELLLGGELRVRLEDRGGRVRRRRTRPGRGRRDLRTAGSSSSSWSVLANSGLLAGERAVRSRRGGRRPSHSVSVDALRAVRRWRSCRRTARPSASASRTTLRRAVLRGAWRSKRRRQVGGIGTVLAAGERFADARAGCRRRLAVDVRACFAEFSHARTLVEPFVGSARVRPRSTIPDDVPARSSRADVVSEVGAIGHAVGSGAACCPTAYQIMSDELRVGSWPTQLSSGAASDVLAGRLLAGTPLRDARGDVQPDVRRVFRSMAVDRAALRRSS